MKNEKGSTLVMVLLIMAIPSILGIGLINSSISDNRFAIKEHDYQKAYYVARAGAEATADYLYNNRMSNSSLNNLISKSTSDMENKSSTDFGGGSFKVSLLTNSYNDLFIQSTGLYDGIERTVKVKLEQKNLFDSAVIALDKITIKNPSNNRINGDIATVNDPYISIVDTHGNPLPETEINNVLYNTHDFYQSPGPFPPAVRPSLSLTTGNVNDLLGGNIVNTSGDLFANTEIGDLNLGSTDLTINLNGSDMDLIFGSLQSNNATITVNGSGLLSIYVDEIDDYKGDIVIGNDAKVIFFVEESGTMNLKTGSSVSNMYIYAPEADVSLTAGYLVVGSIIAENVILESGADITFSDSTGVYPEDVGIDMYSWEMSEWSY